MILTIDTSRQAEVVVTLEFRGKRFEKRSSLVKASAQMVLPLIERLLREHKGTFGDITAITVSTGPGSFTGLRVGLAIANMLGNLLHVPINNATTGVLASVHYEPSKFDRQSS